MFKQRDEKWVYRNFYTRREKANYDKRMDCKIKTLDKENRQAIFQGRAEYQTSLLGCSCPDYARVSYPVPCKHMFRLATELGYYGDDRTLKDESDIQRISEIEELLNNGELIPSQYSLFFDSELGEWLFGLANPINVEFKGRKEPVVMFVCFSFDKEFPIFHLRMKDKSFDMGSSILEDLPTAHEGLSITIGIEISDCNYHLSPHGIEGEAIASSYVFDNMRNEIQQEIKLRERPIKQKDDNTYKLKISSDTEVNITPFVSAEKYTKTERSSQLSVKFKIPRVHFFYQNYCFALNEIRSFSNDINYKSTVFDATLI